MEYYIVDVETTGFSPVHHEVTQISIIRCIDRHQLSKFIAAEFPEKANYQALQVTNRTLNDIIKGDNKKDVVNLFDKFLLQDNKTHEHRCMIAHKADFDRKFLYTLWDKVNKQFPASLWLDTVSLTKKLAKSKGLIKKGSKLSFTLESSLKIANVNNIKPGAHNAIVDTQNTYKLWKTLVDVENIDYLPLIKRVPHNI